MILSSQGRYWSDHLVYWEKITGFRRVLLDRSLASRIWRDSPFAAIAWGTRMNYCYDKRLITHDGLDTAKFKIYYLNRDLLLWGFARGI